MTSDTRRKFCSARSAFKHGHRRRLRRRNSRSWCRKRKRKTTSSPCGHPWNSAKSCPREKLWIKNTTKRKSTYCRDSRVQIKRTFKKRMGSGQANHRGWKPNRRRPNRSSKPSKGLRNQANPFNRSSSSQTPVAHFDRRSEGRGHTNSRLSLIE